MVFEIRVQRSQHAAVGCVVDVAQRQRVAQRVRQGADADRSEEHTSELQSLMRISYAVFCLKKKNIQNTTNHKTTTINTHTNRKTITTTSHDDTTQSTTIQLCYIH